MDKANIKILHPNKDGSGSAIKVDMHYQTERTPGFIRFTFCNQDGSDFNFKNGIECDLAFNEIAEFLSVVKGETDCANGGKPMLTRDEIFFAMKREGDNFAIGACENRDGNILKSQIVLTRAEATGLCGVLESSLFFVAFIKGVNP